MKKILTFLFWFLSVFYLELILRLSVFENFFDLNIFYVLIFSLVVASFIYFITHIFNKKISMVLSFIILIIITLFFIAQFIYFKIYLSFFSFTDMGATKQIMQFYAAIFKTIISNIIVVIPIFIPLVVFIFIRKYLYHGASLLKTFISFIIFIILYISAILLLFLSNPSNPYSPKMLYFDINSPVLSVNNFGLITSMRLDLSRSLFGFDNKIIFINENEDKGSTKVDEKKTEYNVMDIDFDSLIANETNQSIIDMHTYFKNATPTEKNKYTGIFKDKNLVYVLAESFYPLAVDKDLTPTLYKLVNNGFVFDNFYTPIFPGSTSAGEYIAGTGLLTKEGTVNSFQKSATFYLPFVLGNSFSKIGYTAKSFHNNTYTYYRRDLVHPSYGYDYLACGNGLKINCRIWPESDLDMVNATYDMYSNIDKFLTYYVTVSGHLNYTTTGNMMATKNWDYVKDLDYSNAIKSYIACNIELDRALEALISKLEQQGILDDTVIALVSDHYPYGLTVKEIADGATYDTSEPFELHRSNFILWNNKVKTVHVKKFTSNLDVLPTILNLFGVNYDSRILIGKDMLSSSPGLIMFSNRSFITDYGRYNNITKQLTLNEGAKVPDNYLENIRGEVYNKFYLSGKMLDTNYYKILFKGDL